MEVSCQVSNHSFDRGYRRATLKQQEEDYIPAPTSCRFLDSRRADGRYSLPNFSKRVNQYLHRNFRWMVSRTLWGGKFPRSWKRKNIIILEKNLQVANLRPDVKSKRIIGQKSLFYFTPFFRESKLKLEQNFSKFSKFRSLLGKRLYTFYLFPFWFIFNYSPSLCFWL